MAEETRTRRLMEENQAEGARYEDLAKQALLAGNEGDAKVFLAKKQQLESAGAGLVTAYTAAHENAVKMRQMSMVNQSLTHVLVGIRQKN